MYKYKNISQNVQTLSGVGDVKPGDVITVDHVIENPNFKYEGSTESAQGGVIGTQAPQENAVTEATKVQEQTNTQTEEAN